MLRLLRVPGRRHSLRSCAHDAPTALQHPDRGRGKPTGPGPEPAFLPLQTATRAPSPLRCSMHCSRPRPWPLPPQGSPHPCPSCAFPRGRTFSAPRGSDAAASASGLPAGRPAQAPHLGTGAGPRPKPREGLCFHPGSAGPPQTSELKRVPQEPSLSCSTAKQGAPDGGRSAGSGVLPTAAAPPLRS